MKYLEHRCPNLPKENSTRECRGELGGPALDTIKNYDFTKGPFVEIRYCAHCRIFIKITISDPLTVVPEYEILSKAPWNRVANKLFEFVEPWLFSVHGYRPKGK